MVAPEILEAYHRYVPRWFKVIRWRAFADRQIEKYKFSIPCGYLPVAFWFFGFTSPYPIYLCLMKPKTEEERNRLKRDTFVLPFQRDWEIGQYNHERPPYMDVWKRRRNYPEYYEDKYDGYRQDAVAYQQKSPVGSGIIIGTKK